MINVLIYNEGVHEQKDEKVRSVYPEGIHGALKSFLETEDEIGTIRIATLETHREVMTQEALDDTDVLIWWAHMRHGEVDDEVVTRCWTRINQGMGLVALHSGHGSKLFTRLMGHDTSNVNWRESGDKVRVWNCCANHPITQGLPRHFVIPEDETYCEPQPWPEPDKTVFISWYSGGEVFRSGECWWRGEGKVFYFQGGHETFPIYYQKEVQTIIKNAVKWAAPAQRVCKTSFDHMPKRAEEIN
jgi:trehalose utilization protein